MSFKKLLLVQQQNEGDNLSNRCCKEKWEEQTAISATQGKLLEHRKMEQKSAGKNFGKDTIDQQCEW